MKPKLIQRIFFLLCLSFLMYSFSIYRQPLSAKEEIKFNSKIASNGKLIWQKYNCQSCHQLFGLGGYLGPDLSNFISYPQKGEVVLRELLKAGTKQMPSFNLSEFEILELIAFLKSADASGKADPRNFEIDAFGMIEKND